MVDNTTLFRDKIREYIYVYTGCAEPVQPGVVDILERHLLHYLRELRAKCEKATKRKPTVTMEEVYVALSGTPEYYGVRRCVILKQLGKRVQANGEELDQGPEDPSQVSAILASVNDGTLAYKTSEKDRMSFLIRTDKLTEPMSSAEYMRYSKARTKFIKKRELFAEWSTWKPLPSDTVVTALGWLCTSELRKRVSQALERRWQSAPRPDLFAPSRLSFDAEYPVEAVFFSSPPSRNIVPDISSTFFRAVNAHFSETRKRRMSSDFQLRRRR